MQAGAEPHQISTLYLVLREGGPEGFALLILGLMLVLWGLFNLAFVRNRVVLCAQALLSLLPLGMGFLHMCRGLALFLDMARAVEPNPAPEMIAQTVVNAMAAGLFGAAATGVSVFIGIAALTRNLASPRRSERTARTVTSGL